MSDGAAHFSLSGRIEAGQDQEAIAQIRRFEASSLLVTDAPIVIDLSRCESINLRTMLELARWADRLRTKGQEMVFLSSLLSVKRSIEIFVGTHRIRHIENTDDLNLQSAFHNYRDRSPAAWQARLGKIKSDPN